MADTEIQRGSTALYWSLNANMTIAAIGAGTVGNYAADGLGTMLIQSVKFNAAKAKTRTSAKSFDGLTVNEVFSDPHDSLSVTAKVLATTKAGTYAQFLIPSEGSTVVVVCASSTDAQIDGTYYVVSSEKTAEVDGYAQVTLELENRPAAMTLITS
jgi:hypothetical protein